jgi:hypothetical protein
MKLKIANGFQSIRVLFIMLLLKISRYRKTSVDGSAVLELTSTSKGFCLRLTTSQRDAITAAAIGLCILIQIPMLLKLI